MRTILRLILLAMFAGRGLAGPATTGTESTVWHDARRDRDVPVKIYFPAATNAPGPVVIFSHGLGGSRDGYEYLGQAWSAQGYVSIHVQHAGSDSAIWGRMIWRGGKKGVRAVVADPQNAINRLRDVSFVIDELERLNRAGGLFGRQLDLDHIGVAGHSFGAFTALGVAGQVFHPGLNTEAALADPRVKAIIPMSAPVPPNKERLDESYANVTIPCLHMTGTQDMSPIGETTPEQRRLPFDHCRHSDQFLITFAGGDHMVFSGRKWLSSRQDVKIQEFIKTSSTAFWDAYLRNDASARAWLTNGLKTELGRTGTLEFKFPSPPN